MTPRRPPAVRRAGACASAFRSAPGSSLTAMRTAWKVRVATWRRRGHAARGPVPRTAATRSPVRARRPRGPLPPRPDREAAPSSRWRSTSPRRDRPCRPSHRSPIPRRAVAGETRPRRRAPEREPLHSQAREPFEQRRQPVGARALVLLEPAAIPHLELRQSPAHERDLFRESRLLARVRRDEHASRRVERHVLGARDEEPAQLAHFGIEDRLLAQFRLDALPLLQWMHLEAVIVRDDNQRPLVLREDVPEFRRYAQAPLRVDRVLIPSSKHIRNSRILVKPSSHYAPLEMRD